MYLQGMSGCGGGLVEALNTKVYGNATQTLVLAHGFGADQTVWQYLIPVLACYFRVVVFDLVVSPSVNHELYDPERYEGYGSYARDLVCILDELNVKKSVYLGHSMSAMIGCVAAINQPDLFQHLILLNGSPRYLNKKGYKGGLERSDLEATFSYMQHNFSEWVHYFGSKAVGVDDKTAISMFESTLGKMDPDIALNALKNVLTGDYRSVLPHVLIATTIIQSEEDFVVPKSVAFYMKKKLGGHVKVKILKTKGHLPQLSDHTLLLKVLKKILSWPIDRN